MWVKPSGPSPRLGAHSLGGCQGQETMSPRTSQKGAEKKQSRSENSLKPPPGCSYLPRETCGKKWNPPCYPVKNIADGFPCVQTCSLVKKWTFSYNKINHLPGGSGSAPFSLWLLKAKKHNPKVMLQLQFCFLSPKKKLTWHPTRPSLLPSPSEIGNF